MKRILPAILLALACSGCGVTVFQREKHAYLVHVVSEPKYEPKTSVTEAILAPVRDVTQIPKNAVGGSVASDVVQAAGNARIKFGKAVLPVDREHAYLIQVTAEGFTIQALPTHGPVAALPGVGP